MRAVTIQDGRLVVAERPDPEPGSGELLVRVAAAGIDGGDLAQLEGHYPAPPGSPADVPGLELAGEVAGPAPSTSSSSWSGRPTSRWTEGAGLRRPDRGGRRRPLAHPVEATFPPEAAQQAYDRFAAGRRLGKVVLVTGSGPAG